MFLAMLIRISNFLSLFLSHPSMRSALILFFATLCLSVGQVVHAEAIPLRSYTYGPLSSTGKSLWVAPNGSDETGLGTQARPYATPGVASLHAMPGDTIVVKTGTYSSFGSLRRSGSEAHPIVVRPEPQGHPVFLLQSDEAAVEIAASHLRIFGMEISHPVHASAMTCMRVTRPVEDIALTDLHVHDCETGLQLTQPVASVQRLSITDSEFYHLASAGIVCRGGACADVNMVRVQVRDIPQSDRADTGILFGASSTRVVLEASSVLDVAGNAVTMQGTEPLVTNLTVSSSFDLPASHAVLFSQGGTLLNSDVRVGGSGVQLIGGAGYRLRGNLIRSVTTDPQGYALQVLYGPAQADRPGVLLLDANRIMTRGGRVGLPKTSAGVPAPLLTTLKSNTFFFDDLTSGADLTDGRFVAATSVSSATGTGIINLLGNISVVGEPEADDLISPIIQGAMTTPSPWSGGIAVFPGARLKGSGPTIYLYSALGQRHAFPNESVYRSWFFDFRDVTQISDEAMSKIPLGRNVTYRPGVRLVKVTTDPKVYAVGAGRSLRWIKTEEIARTLFGSQWSHQIDDIPDAYFVNYRMGDPIESAAAYHPDQERAQVANPSETFQD